MMTWNEFKKHVDEYLESQGETGDVEIFYIDTHMPNVEFINITIDREFFEDGTVIKVET